MLIWIIQSIIISVIFILILHNLICYFKDTLTIPKIKDLISSPSVKYENIYNILSNSNTEPLNNSLNNSPKVYSNSDDTPISSMKNELKNFLKSQLNVPSVENAPQHLESSDMSYSVY